MRTTTTSRKTGILACLASLITASCGGGGGGIAVTPTTPGGNNATVAFIRFASQPGNATAGQSFSVGVELVSSSGVRVTTAGDPVTLTVSGGATLLGPSTVNAAGGLATFSGVSLTKAGAGFQITAASGSFTATSSAFSIGAAAVDPAHSIFAPASFTANVATTLTFTFRDVYGNATPSATVSLSTTAPGSTFTPASGTTGTDGTFVTSFRTTTGGAVPITATVGGVAVLLTASVTSTVGTVNVNIRDAGGTLVPATTYTLTYPGGSSQFTATTGADVISNVPAGAISVSAVKSGYNTGTASGTLTAGGALTLNVVMAVTTASCTPVAMTFPGSVTGTLSATSCQQASQLSAIYQFAVGSAQGVHFTLTPSGFAPLLTVQNAPTPSIYYTNASGVAIQNVMWLLPPGSYQVRAAATSGTGAFTLTGSSDAGNLTTATAGGVVATSVRSCPVWAVLLVSVTTSGQSLTTSDCTEVVGTSSYYYDTYLVYSSSACTITMRSTAFDAYLEVYDRSTDSTLVRADNNSGGGTDAQIVLTACNNSGNILEIRANSNFARATGAYTLTLAIQGSATAVASASSQRTISLERPRSSKGLIEALRSRGISIPR